jgi:hypothetical protein
VLVEQLLSMGVGVEHRPVDADNLIAGADSGSVRTGAHDDLTDDPRTRHIDLQNHTVVRTRQEHVCHRQCGDQKREKAGREQTCSAPVEPKHPSHDTRIGWVMFASPPRRAVRLRQPRGIAG